tara:strand:+ start:158 stop:721 length:564 start_codon:yes stop_codon:yes gene_type:complete
MSIESLNEFIINIINKEFIKYIENIDYTKKYPAREAPFIEDPLWEKKVSYINDEFWEKKLSYINILDYDYDFRQFKKAKIIMSMIVYLTQNEYFNEYDPKIFIEIFSDEKNCFEKLVKAYFYYYSGANNYQLVDYSSILYYGYLVKHGKLIDLYNKLDRKSKKKNTIIKILNSKFNQDIIQNIISAY